MRSSIDLLTADESMSSLLVRSGFYLHSMGVIRFQIHSVLKRESSRQVLVKSLCSWFLSAANKNLCGEDSLRTSLLASWLTFMALAR